MNVSVSTDFLKKVVGLTEATKSIIAKQAAVKEASAPSPELREQAAQATAELVKRGYVESIHANAVIEGFVSDPGKVMQTLTKLAARMPNADEVPAQGTGVKEAATDEKESDRIWNEGFGLTS